MSKKCTQCGAELEENALFCDECGAQQAMPETTASSAKGQMSQLNKRYIVIGILLFLFIIFGGLFWLGSSSDDETAERKISDGRGDGDVVEKTVSVEEEYDDREYAVDDMDGDISYGLNEPVEFEAENGGKISVIFTEYGKKDDTLYISYMIHNIGEIPVTVGEDMFSVYANDYVADLDYGEKTIYEETISSGRKVSGRLYPRVALDQVRKLEVECGDVIFLLRDTSAVDAMLGTYYRQYEENGDIITDEIRLYREESNNALTISAIHHIDYGNGYVSDYDSDFFGRSFQLFDDRIEFTNSLYPVGGLIVSYSENPIQEGISVTQVDTVSTIDMFTGSYEWTDNIQKIYESAKSAGTVESAEFVENTVQERESILLNNLYIDKVSASSELTDSGNAYKVEALFDGNKDTCWAEGVDGIGEGEYIEVWFTTPLYLTQIEFLNGYMKNEDVFKANGRIKKAELRFSDGSSCEANLENSDMVSFESPVLTDYLKITILEAESGTKYDDTCLSEITMWGYQDNRTKIPEDTELTAAGKNGKEFYINDSILGTYSCYMGEDFGAEITLTYDEKNRQLYISGNCWEGMNVGMIEDEMISSFVSEENALLYDDGYGNQLYIYPLDTGEIYIKQNGSFGGIGTTFEGTYEK